MQITTTRSDIIPVQSDSRIVQGNLTNTELMIVNLSVSSQANKKIRDSDLLSLSSKIRKIVKIRLGLKEGDVKEEDVFLQVLEADCNKFPNLTEGEVLKALEMGIDGYFNPDKDIFFTSSLFVKWLRAYQKLREPAISKHAQLMHQVKDREIVQSMEDRVRTAASIANGYADFRRKDPDHRVDGGAGIYQNLESTGIYKLPDGEKREIFNRVKCANPKDSEEDIRVKCQNIAYNRFIAMLVELECKISETGEIVNLEDHE